MRESLQSLDSKRLSGSRIFLLCTLTGGDQRQDNKKSADKKETKVGDFSFNITAWGRKSFATSHVQWAWTSLQIKILLHVSIQGEYIMPFFGPIIVLVQSSKIPLKSHLAEKEPTPKYCPYETYFLRTHSDQKGSLPTVHEKTSCKRLTTSGCSG